MALNSVVLKGFIDQGFTLESLYEKLKHEEQGNIKLQFLLIEERKKFYESLVGKYVRIKEKNSNLHLLAHITSNLFVSNSNTETISIHSTKLEIIIRNVNILWLDPSKKDTEWEFITKEFFEESKASIIKLYDTLSKNKLN